MNNLIGINMNWFNKTDILRSRPFIKYINA